MGSRSVTCHPAELTFPPLPQLIKAGTRFSHPGGMQGWVDLVGLVTYWGGIPAQRWSPIPVLTGPNVDQLRSCHERCYHYARPPTSDKWCWCTDTDECVEPASESCRQSNGVCDGFNPPGSFSCQCGRGYELADNSNTECIGNDTKLFLRHQHCH